VLQPPDLVVMFAVSRADNGWTLRSLANRLGVKHSKVQRALGRLSEAGLYDADRRRLIDPAVEEFLVHALKYLHPIAEGPVVRGFPTAWGASPLNEQINSTEPSPVWPDAHGTVRGPAVAPLDDSLVALTREWPEVAELAALADGLRLGDARTRSAAQKLLLERIRTVR
jgi:DNA-binding transcriptional MocR family regulator